MGTGGATNASSINDLRGSIGIIGIGGGQVVGVTVEGVIGPSYRGVNINAGFTLGIIPVDMYGLGSQTYVINFTDIANKIRELFGPYGGGQLKELCE